jgi:hypothetical protein
MVEIEMFVIKNHGKKTILLAKDPIPTPWPVNFTDCVISLIKFSCIVYVFFKRVRGW